MDPNVSNLQGAGAFENNLMDEDIQYQGIITLGMHRSGTSVVSGLIESMGAYFGCEEARMQPQPDNPKGFWERSDVVEINDAFLNLAGGSWYRIHGLDLSAIPVEEIDRLQWKVSQVIADLDQRQTWMIKDPRFCLTLPLWLSRIGKPVVVMVIRNPIEIADSLYRRNGIPLYIGISLWEAYTRSALRVTTGLPRVIVKYDELLRDPALFCGELLDQLQELGVEGLAASLESGSAYIVDKTLKHETRSEQVIRKHLNPEQINLWDCVVNSRIDVEPELYLVSESAQRALRDFAKIDSRIESMRSQEKAYIFQIEELKGQVKETKQQEENHVHQISVLNNWIRQLLEDTEAIFLSYRWRVGSTIARIVECLLFRGRPETVQDHVKQLAGEYRSWHAVAISQYASELVEFSDGNDPQSVMTKTSVRRLMATMLRNPKKTIELLNIRRIRNFFITCFKQPEHVRKEIIKDYLSLYASYDESGRKVHSWIKRDRK